MCSLISLFMVHRSSVDRSWRFWWPVIRANIFSSSREVLRKFPTLLAPASPFSLALSSGSWVATPTGHMPVPQIRYCWHPKAIRAAEATATASAPMAMAFAKSEDTRRPPVMIRLMSEPMLSRSDISWLCKERI